MQSEQLTGKNIDLVGPLQIAFATMAFSPFHAFHCQDSKEANMDTAVGTIAIFHLVY